MIGIIIGAGILMIILAVMEGGEMPDWVTMIQCVLAITIPSIIVNSSVSEDLWFVGPLVGAACGAIAISALWGMELKRAATAAGIYLLIQIGISFAMVSMMG